MDTGDRPRDGEDRAELRRHPPDDAAERREKRRKRRRDRERDRALIGAVLAGKYEVVDILGQGGFGSVFLVKNLSMGGQRLAMKMLPEELASSERFRDQFLAEIRVAMQMTDKYIATIRDSGVTEDGRLYYTMDYIEGKTLQKLLEEEKRIAPGRILPIIGRVLKALSVAHGRGIIHRDLKPANIMIVSDGGKELPRVLDFGIATAIGERAADAEGAVGTPHYMAPEQFRGRRLDAAADLYSVGVILYECLTGQRPYPGSDAREIYRRLELGPPPDAVTLAPEIDGMPGLADLVRRSIERDPARRFQSAREFFEAIGAVIQGSAKRRGEAEGDRKPPRERKPEGDGDRRGRRAGDSSSMLRRRSSRRPLFADDGAWESAAPPRGRPGRRALPAVVLIAILAAAVASLLFLKMALDIYRAPSPPAASPPGAPSPSTQEETSADRGPLPLRFPARKPHEPDGDGDDETAAASVVPASSDDGTGAAAATLASSSDDETGAAAATPASSSDDETAAVSPASASDAGAERGAHLAPEPPEDPDGRIGASESAGTADSGGVLHGDAGDGAAPDASGASAADLASRSERRGFLIAEAEAALAEFRPERALEKAIEAEGLGLSPGGELLAMAEARTLLGDLPAARRDLDRWHRRAAADSPPGAAEQLRARFAEGRLSFLEWRRRMREEDRGEGPRAAVVEILRSVSEEAAAADAHRLALRARAYLGWIDALARGSIEIAEAIEDLPAGGASTDIESALVRAMCLSDLGERFLRAAISPERAARPDDPPFVQEVKRRVAEGVRRVHRERCLLAHGKARDLAASLLETSRDPPPSLVQAAHHILALAALRSGTLPPSTRVDKADLRAALSHLEQALGAGRDDAAIRDVWGDVLEALGDDEAAAVHLAAAYWKEPLRRRCLRAGEVCARTRAHRDEGRRIIEDWLRRDPGDREIEILQREKYSR